MLNKISVKVSIKHLHKMIVKENIYVSLSAKSEHLLQLEICY